MCGERKAVRAPAMEPRPVVAARAAFALAKVVSAGAALQQRLGNHGAQEFATQVARKEASPGSAAGTGSSTGQYSISRPGDAQEREADHVADIIMRMADPSTTLPTKSAPTGAVIQRRCAECEQEGKGPNVQRKEGSAAAPHITSSISAGISALKGVGSPLPASSRAFFEPRFGANLSNVRVHTGSQAADTAGAINARAFTVGHDIAFNAGQYAPHSQEGQRLLAHELTHVIQQGAGGRTEVQRQAEDESTRSTITKGYVAGLSDKEIHLQISAVVRQVRIVDTRSAEYSALLENLALLLQERASRSTKKPPVSSALMQMMVDWHAAGLLDPPYRPADIPEIPPLPVTQAQAATLGLSPSSIVAGGLAVPKFLPEPMPVPPARPPLRLVPPLEPVPPTVPAPVRVPVAVPILVALIVLLWPTETAPPWMDEINPVTGYPYGSPEEYEWVRRLTPSQRDYLDRLRRSRRITPNPADDGEPDPTEVPVPVPKPKPKEKKGEPEPCLSMDVRRKGGHVRHDAYATKVTGSIFDYFVRTPFGLAINYDGLRAPIIVWEVKVGHGWFFNSDYATLRDLKLAKWDVQKNLGLLVAATCGYQHVWSIPDKRVASLLSARWGGFPAVLSIPE